MVARRGDALQEHILWVAKDVFLEVGFERASMDEIAARAETSKRTLYAHFENKEKLFLAILLLARELFLSKLKLPGDYSVDPAQALTMFCGRYLEILLYSGWIRMCRMGLAEAERFPEASTQSFEVLFSAVQERLSAYLKKTFGLSAKSGTEAAQKLLGQILYPRYMRALFGVDAPAEKFGPHDLAADFNLKPIRKAVAELLASLA
jgi:AcrR family transcriptional regulator